MQIALNKKYTTNDNKIITPIIIRDGVVYCRHEDGSTKFLSIETFIKSTHIILDNNYIKVTIPEKKETKKTLNFISKPKNIPAKSKPEIIQTDVGKTVLDTISQKETKSPNKKDNKKINKVSHIKDYEENGF